MTLQIPGWLRPLLGRDLLWKIKPSSKVIYLTFDDGPVPGVTPDVLNILSRYHWKATFFCVGENVFKSPELYQRLLDEGHQVGNHTFNHFKGYQHSTDAYLANVRKAAGFIDSRLFRPPHGQITYEQIRQIREEFTIVMWDVITFDYDASLSPGSIMKIIKKNLRPGSVVVFHDSLKARKNVLEVLPKALEYWTEQGYSYGLL